ncbi:MAG TPA: ornithine--oxo-acid transaminase [Myxococcota bacterium]|nr:ornithine--oxo-acid transaminase [Myxococcota bacterium]HRY95736.1 ornithine--oxo-acid transaminase [Myxococcota bacterium]HSA22578.1 ornithine--oxo-acid transaminase [Myxococcota bacterium]
MANSREIIEITEKYSAHNYHPLPVVISRAEGAYVWDCEGKKYLDFLSAYSAVNQGHRHPKIIQALVEQAGRVTLTSRAFHNDQLGPFLKELCALAGFPKALPMNTGAEAVETALKLARKWGYKVKGVPDGQAEIICCGENFHGRTISIVSFSTDEQYRDGFGPFTPGFKVVPYGDGAALEKAFTKNTVAFLVEPIQGEAGVVVPPEGYLKKARALCDKHRALFIADEIQTGLGRTGKMFCFEHEGIRPDVLVLGKAISGGVLPVSAVLASEEQMGVFKPGDHGSTFGGCPIGCAVARAALRVLVEEKLAARAAELGGRFKERLAGLCGKKIESVRGRGLLLAMVLKKSAGPARPYCEQLMVRGMLCKETHQHIIRLAPPLVIGEADLDLAFEHIQATLG